MSDLTIPDILYNMWKCFVLVMFGYSLISCRNWIWNKPSTTLDNYEILKKLRKK